MVGVPGVTVRNLIVSRLRNTKDFSLSDKQCAVLTKEHLY
jgi:hypothetical protein